MNWSTTIIATWMCGCVIVGCKSAPKPNANETISQAFATSDLKSAGGVITVADLMAMNEREALFGLVNAEGQIAKQFRRVRTPTQQFSATMQETDHEREVEYRVITDAGEMAMPAHIDLKENVVTRFSPPLILFPSQLEAGVPFTSRAQMRVVDRRNPNRLRESGTAERIIEYVGDQTIRTPLGEFDAKRIEAKFSAKLRMATAQDHITMFVVPGLGVIAEQIRSEVKVLGAFGSKDDRTLILLPSAASSTAQD